MGLSSSEITCKSVKPLIFGTIYAGIGFIYVGSTYWAIMPLVSKINIQLLLLPFFFKSSEDKDYLINVL